VIALGVDPASKKAGLAVVDRRYDKILSTEQFVSDPKAGHPQNMLDFWQRVGFLIVRHGVTHVGVERVHVSYNLNSVRLIAYFEAAAMMAGQAANCQVEQIVVTSARKRVLGSGKLKKADAIQQLKRKYIVRQHNLTGLSDDEWDAVLMALAVQ